MPCLGKCWLFLCIKPLARSHPSESYFCGYAAEPEFYILKHALIFNKNWQAFQGCPVGAYLCASAQRKPWAAWGEPSATGSTPRALLEGSRDTPSLRPQIVPFPLPRGLASPEPGSSLGSTRARAHLNVSHTKLLNPRDFFLSRRLIYIKYIKSYINFSVCLILYIVPSVWVQEVLPMFRKTLWGRSTHAGATQPAWPWAMVQDLPSPQPTPRHPCHQSQAHIFPWSVFFCSIGGIKQKVYACAKGSSSA